MDAYYTFIKIILKVLACFIPIAALTWSGTILKNAWRGFALTGVVSFDLGNLVGVFFMSLMAVVVPVGSVFIALMIFGVIKPETISTIAQDPHLTGRQFVAPQNLWMGSEPPKQEDTKWKP